MKPKSLLLPSSFQAIWRDIKRKLTLTEITGWGGDNPTAPIKDGYGSLGSGFPWVALSKDPDKPTARAGLRVLAAKADCSPGGQGGVGTTLGSWSWERPRSAQPERRC